MLLPRIIPCLLIHNKGLVKTVKFKSPRYIGDPINAVRIFNEKQVDEIMILDIDATVIGRPPDYSMISDLSSECRMPLCYGGGVAEANQVQKIIQLGVEKVAISSGLLSNPNLITESAKRVGSQSLVGVIDIKKVPFIKKYDIWTHNATKRRNISPLELAIRWANEGIGELVLNFVDSDGCQNGYNLNFVSEIFSKIDIPVTVLGGAGSLSDIGDLIYRFNIIGAAAGSLFVYKGELNGVLINYPGSKEKESILSKVKYHDRVNKDQK